MARVVIVGGRSRSGLAVRAALAGHEVIGVVRGPAGPDEIAIADYAEVPPSLDLRDAAIVVCAGAVSGTDDSLMRANREVPLAWARAGIAAGARQFVQLSSFSLFGHQQAIGHATPQAPASPYGRSKLAAEHALEALDSGDMALARLRVPILIGAGADKLAKLVRLALRTGFMPVAPWPTPRSMLSYGALADAVRRIVEEGTRGPLFAADPEPFTADLLCAAARDAGQRVRPLRVPRPALALLVRTAPGLHASLFLPNLLDGRDNFLKAGVEGESLRAVLARMMQQARAR